jgi:hypothetical protein
MAIKAPMTGGSLDLIYQQILMHCSAEQLLKEVVEKRSHSK